MFRSYLITALRNFTRHKLYSFINIAGLAGGLACVLFILLFLRDELNWDKWIPGTDNLYRLSITFTAPGRGDEFFPVVQFTLPIAMHDEIPEVTGETHIVGESMTAAIGDRQLRAPVVAVDPNFLRLVPMPMAAGNPATALAKPESLVLSESEARKLFGTPNAMGKSLVLNGIHTMTVTAILRDGPHDSGLGIDAMIPNTSSADTLPAGAPGRTNWLNVVGGAYVKLAPGAKVDQVVAKLPAMLNRHVDMKKGMNIALPASEVMHVHLVPFNRMYLDPGGLTKHGRWTTFYGFAAIAGLILLIACINYMNLATARAIMRAREVSIRKVMGARRSQLIA